MPRVLFHFGYQLTQFSAFNTRIIQRDNFIAQRELQCIFEYIFLSSCKAGGKACKGFCREIKQHGERNERYERLKVTPDGKGVYDIAGHNDVYEGR